MDKKQFNFEKALSELESINKALSEEEVSLDQAIQQYEKGVKLSGEALKFLNQSEKKVKQAIEKNGQLELIDFEDQES